MAARWCFVALLALGWLVLRATHPTPALAHATLVASYPNDGSVLAAAPPSIHLWFSGPVDPAGRGITVIGPSGARVRLGRLHADGLELWADLSAGRPGTYLVVWQVIALDTHPSLGRITFSIGRAGPLPGSPGSGTDSTLGLALQALARWLHTAGYALGFGPFAFALLALRPLGLWQGEEVQRPLDRLIGVGILALVLAEPLALLGQTASLGGGSLWDADLAGTVLSSSFGRVLAQRLGAAVALWMLVGALRAGAGRARALILALGLALVLIDGQASHAVSSGPLWLGLAANMLHLAAMGIWIGGLASLLALWDLPAVAPRRGALLRRFGYVATLCLCTLAITGAIMAVIHLARPASLTSSTYGAVLLLKLALLIGALVLALLGGRATDARRPGWWRGEVLALLVVLALAGLLVSLAPPA